MGIAEDLPILESRLTELITRYEQYFIGVEKREPLRLLAEVDQLVRRYATAPITNTMYKHRYTSLVARLSSYRQLWNKTVREIEEGRYARDRFRARLNEERREQGEGMERRRDILPPVDPDLERVYRELQEARSACNLPPGGVTREQLAATLAKQRPELSRRLGTDDIRFRVVVENGKPRIKAGKTDTHT
ncbi:MXAN_5187 C-terminal domain-containing protein [Trichlorobacter ammonificans]|uniref:Uncharacterized protein n=1 Tax=Trichlorobacter ammonificans TaxID=2916410 RepID=A0ABM9DB85_9BACT|nr:MXAN_5187 C-terminal domain-containing protein [Trichlorobacter ammonificans]CAH2032499.1 conserved protein of unknown function [Trichlorobacter ammonificans]